MKKLPAWAILTLIAAVAALLLGATNGVTSPIIQEGAIAQAEATRTSLFASADSFSPMDLPEGSKLDNCYEAISGGNVVGHVAQITVNGFGGPIEIMVGMDEAGMITGLSVGGANFAETAGLGARAKEPKFTDQFAGVTAPAELGKDIDAITGATISSSAVVNGVNEIAAYIETLG